MFVKDLYDIDLASCRGILPFDTMGLRKPHGASWRKEDIKEIKERIDYDLGYDGYRFDLRTDIFRRPNWLKLKFKWKERQ